MFGLGLMLQDVRYILGELGLEVLQLNFSSGFGAIHDLGLAKGRPMFKVVLTDRPS